MSKVSEALVSGRVKSSVNLFHDVENEAFKQIEKALQYDFVKKIMVFPDVHAGYDIPIGCAVLTDGIVMPSYVGYDIGCSVSTSEHVMRDNWWKEDLSNLHERLMEKLIVGVCRTNKHFEWWYEKQIADPFRALSVGRMSKDDVEHIISRGSGGIGTLGSGNHFIEIGRVENCSTMFITIHSGSRGFGHALGDYFMKKYPDGISSEDREAYVLYMRSHHMALKFAELNHAALRDVCMSVCKDEHSPEGMMLSHLFNQHNFVEQVDSQVFLHRKGCTKFDFPTPKGEGWALIPGNMLQGVYLVKSGKDATKWNDTCSHGAGRVMSRGQAKKTFEVEGFKAVMQVGKVVGNFSKDNIDEHPLAYKDIHNVIDIQKRLDILDFEESSIIIPAINIKG